MRKLIFYCIGTVFLASGYSCSSGLSSSAVNGTSDKAEADGTDQKPNIIFIMADDLGFAEVASYGNGFNETPNLDRLEAEGIKFNNAYAAAPVCSPTRASFVTGQFPARVGITDFIAPKTGRYLDPEKFITINEALATTGYHTGYIGKWHLDTDFKNNIGGPVNHGFDEVIGTETKYIADGDYFFPYDKINTFDEGAEDEFLTDRLASEAVDFIRRNKEEPFFLYLSHYSVHTTLDAPQSLVDKYKKKFNEKYGKGQAEKIFDANKRHQANHIDNPYLAAMIERIDAGVGSIMEELDRNGLADNTLLIFFSDNGGAFRVANNGGLRMHKTWLYEGGIKEPLLMRWPEKIKAGTTTDVPVTSLDFYPTFVEAAGGENPTGYQLDGLSLIPLITEGTAPERDVLYWHYPSETGNWKNRMSSAVRQGDYKLIQFYEDNRIELYNLKDDPAEEEDLADKMPEKTEELHSLLTSWRSEVQAEEPVIN
jgi:arylsulfatase A